MSLRFMVRHVTFESIIFFSPTRFSPPALEEIPRSKTHHSGIPSISLGMKIFSAATGPHLDKTGMCAST